MPYPTDHETLAAFLAARTRENRDATMSNMQFYDAVTAWCSTQGVPPISHSRASRYLLSRGYRQHSNREDGRKWIGLMLHS